MIASSGRYQQPRVRFCASSLGSPLRPDPRSVGVLIE